MSSKNTKSSKEAPIKSTKYTPHPFVSSFFIILAGVLVAAAVQSHGKLPQVFGPASSAKPYRNFSSFYPFYLGEHSDPTCRNLHVIGTLLVCVMLLISYRTIYAMVIAGAVGYMACEMFVGVPHGLYEFALMGFVFVVVNKILTGSSGIKILLVGYGFAWVGHYFFEGNSPATFIYPSYSLMGDYRMMYEHLTHLAQQYLK
eukprot:TRINITY_DN2988_c0_g1_i1.p1 TRINITY_DN2988_c0_g1~~TRINITY_DN2988_c0_g1_i1.p1  ORF type:complete len:201 (-),score=19.74 TRINITY_DN2988_c0_g1_i1:29-631(-)